VIPRNEALELIEGLEKASRRTRPFLLYGLFAIIAGFAILSFSLKQQRDREAATARELRASVQELKATLNKAAEYTAALPRDLPERQQLATLLKIADRQTSSLNALASKAAPTSLPIHEEPTEAKAEEGVTGPVVRTSLPSVETKVKGGSKAVATLRPVTRIIVRDTQQADLRAELGGLQAGRVSYHYLIDQEGKIHRLKNENDVAFHTTGANQDSIGIGVLHVSGSGDYTPQQVKSLASLIKEIASRRGISPDRIFSAKDIDPRRASDFGMIKEQILAEAF